MEKLNKDEFITLMNFLGKPTLTQIEKNILRYLLCCERPFTIGYICQKLDYTTQEIRDCFAKVYKAFIVYESEDGDKSKNRFIFDETTVGRITDIIDVVEDNMEKEKMLDYFKEQIEETDMAESHRNGLKVLINIYQLLQHKRHFVYAIEKLKEHSRIWCGQRIPCDKYKYSNMLEIANNTYKNYEFSDAQKVKLDKCIATIKHNDYSTQ